MQEFKSISGYCGSLLQHFDDAPDSSLQTLVMEFWRQNYGQYAAYTHLLALKSGRLLIFCHNSAVASRIRLEQNSISHNLSGQYPSISSIDIKVMPQDRLMRRKHYKKAHLSAESARLIEKLADSVNHPPLQKALRKLSKSQQENQE